MLGELSSVGHLPQQLAGICVCALVNQNVFVGRVYPGVDVYLAGPELRQEAGQDKEDTGTQKA